ncbi:hypothetical protein PgNI_10172 [Pyricularia grisea]|uniref:Uncharacterized protein n=1 Tax=Pyricularia grisea TaxID=148305 RepID=A0A6P8AZN8_PYRGI|nr:hypothetical protein PgNI_10172 [Pyricularia grisea]TLD07769.1 hypothetical protein PgNI_10172 [Pyricularia grisea]
MFKKRKEDQGVGLEAGGGGALGKPQLSSDGILQVEPQELLADPPEPKKDLEVRVSPIEIKADGAIPVRWIVAKLGKARWKNRSVEARRAKEYEYDQYRFITESRTVTAD